MIDDPEVPPVGVIPIDDQTAHFRVWADKAKSVELVLGTGEASQTIAMEDEGRGFYGATVPRPKAGDRYAYKLDGGEPKPDPVSRWQPDGVAAPSAVFDPGGFVWDEGGWNGIARDKLVFYELHVGTFTPEGTFDAVIPRLPDLVELGITAIEIMPVAQFPGECSWGYDGVHPFAVQNTYGGPEGLHRLVEACHRAGLAIFLDVIYNHFGPEANVFPEFASYLTEKSKTDWGPAVNFDDRGCDPVRAMVIDNVRMWIGAYRFDGLRLDAADQIYDRGPTPILADVSRVAHAEGLKLGRPVYLFAETDLNDAPRFLGDLDRGGYGLDGHWTDDFHHAAHVVLTGETNGYYEDFADGPAALAKAYRSIFVNDGAYSPFRGRRHGTPATGMTGDRFVAFTQNHDQVGNRFKSDRHGTSLPPERGRLAAGILLLAPRLPLLFMGEEYFESRPFPFFCDFKDEELTRAVREGRKKEFAYFGWEGEVPDPFDRKTRDSAVLSWTWADDPTRAGLRRLYQTLIRLRREVPALRDFRTPRARLLGEAGLPDVLELIREADDPTRTLRILYNLGDERRDLPGELAGDGPSLRSEVGEFGGSAGEEAGPGRLAPREFAIFGPLA
ncbi:malto-oligosyltrehalose trehalohydrolase [Tundrisphaera sp. TA3]|uniref:malto-oligosyltrehalose trehalohydrolase n=1 Tax=Tundrisphaera sp. TA3 TaxID=3435775 RepID=UPI003EBF8D50